MVKTDCSSTLGLVSRSNGITYKIYPSLEEAKKTDDLFLPRELRNINDEQISYNYTAKGLAARYYYNLANYYLENGDNDKSTFYLTNAIEYDNNAMSLDYRDFIAHRAEWRRE